MQQTPKYKLNLIETSDRYSPNPLNENAQKLEAAITAEAVAETEAYAAGDAALDGRVKVLELHKVAAGYYVWDGEQFGDTQIIELGSTPAYQLRLPPASSR